MLALRNPLARAEARVLVAAHSGSAVRLVEAERDRNIDRGDIGDALHLDHVRREIERIYKFEGK